jgi:hypothetical protein
MVYFYNQQYGLYAHMLTCDNEKLTGKLPGEWVYKQLRCSDLTKGGSFGLKSQVAIFDKEVLSRVNPREVEIKNKMSQIKHEMEKDFSWYLKGRTSSILGRTGQVIAHKKKKRKIVFVGARTGKVLKVINQ